MAHSILPSVFCLASAVTTLAAAQETPAAKPPTGAAEAASDLVLAAEYFIVPGDILKVSVWREPELSGEASVRLDGRITVPLLGDLMAAGRTPNDLAAEMQSKLARFLEVPQVTLAVSQSVSARFFALGEVAKPGTYPIPTRLTVLQALALCGGFREFAKKESVVIVRHEGTRQVLLVFNFKEVEAGVKLEQNIYLEAGDTIIVP